MAPITSTPTKLTSNYKRKALRKQHRRPSLRVKVIKREASKAWKTNIDATDSPLVIFKRELEIILDAKRDANGKTFKGNMDDLTNNLAQNLNASESEADKEDWDIRYDRVKYLTAGLKQMKNDDTNKAIKGILTKTKKRAKKLVSFDEFVLTYEAPNHTEDDAVTKEKKPKKSVSFDENITTFVEAHPNHTEDASTNTGEGYIWGALRGGIVFSA